MPVNGNRSKIQFGIEETYGVPVSPTKQVQYSSEGFKFVLDRKSEGLLTGGKTAGREYITGTKTEGQMSLLARPDDVAVWLALALGVESLPELVSGSVGAYQRQFIPIGNAPGDFLPSATFLVDRIVDVYSYSGCMVNSLSFSAAAGDYLKLDIGLLGYDEGEGASLATGLSYSPLKSFQFRHGTYSVNGVPLGEVTSVKFDYANGMSMDTQTSESKIHYARPEPGVREISAELEVLFSADTAAIRRDYAKTDDLVSVELSFTADEEVETGFPYSLTFSMPACQVQPSDVNVSGPERLKQTISVKAVEDGGQEAVTATLVNGSSTPILS